MKSLVVAATFAMLPIAAQAVTVTNTTDVYTVDNVFIETGADVGNPAGPLSLLPYGTFYISGTAQNNVGTGALTGFSASQEFSNDTGADWVFSAGFALPGIGFTNPFLEVSTDGGLTFSALPLSDTNFSVAAGNSFTLRWGADDVTLATSGFDIFVAAVPLPAGALLLLTGLGGLVVARRRKTA